MFSLAVFLISLIILSPVSLVSLVMKKPEEKKDEITAPAAVEPIILGEPSPALEILKGETGTDDLPIVMHGREIIREKVFPTEGRPFSRREAPARKGEYELPRIEFLNLPTSASARPAREDILSSSTLLEKKLKDFEVEGKVIQVHSGPVVTMYEFEPAPGVKINRVVSLSDDLALSLKAQSVRVSTMPGKAVLGIEVPNKNRETVSIREIISSERKSVV